MVDAVIITYSGTSQLLSSDLLYTFENLKIFVWEIKIYGIKNCEVPLYNELLTFVKTGDIWNGLTREVRIFVTDTWNQ